MQKYEYETVACGYFAISTEATHMSQDGWRVVSLATTDDGYVLLFERPLPQSPEVRVSIEHQMKQGLDAILESGEPAE